MIRAKNAKSQRSPWTVRINFNFPLIWRQIVTSPVAGTAQLHGQTLQLCFPSFWVNSKGKWTHDKQETTGFSSECQKCVPNAVAAAPSDSFPSSTLGSRLSAHSHFWGALILYSPVGKRRKRGPRLQPGLLKNQIFQLSTFKGR